MPPTPKRPWIRDDVPLVWRSDTSIEMGWPPGQARLDAVDHGHVAWLLSLHGDRTMDEGLASGRAQGLRPSTMRRLVRAASQCGLLDDAAALPQTLREAPLDVREHLADDLAAVRHLYGPGAPAVFERRGDCEVMIHGEGQVADVIAVLLTRSGVGRILRGQPTHAASRRHRQAATTRTCHVLCVAAHPDAASDVDAMALDIPHLAVSAAGPRAVIGPLVLPGATSCLRCRDLHLADADPTWPRAAVQWARRRPAAPATGLAHVAGSMAALQVLALVDAGPGSVTAPTIDGALVITLPGAEVALESRPAHPLCGCRWPRTGRGVSA